VHHPPLDRLDLRTCDLPQHLHHSFDFVMCDPPYINPQMPKAIGETMRLLAKVPFYYWNIPSPTYLPTLRWDHAPAGEGTYPTQPYYYYNFWFCFS
jgi:hypothetical protein